MAIPADTKTPEKISDFSEQTPKKIKLDLPSEDVSFKLGGENEDDWLDMDRCESVMARWRVASVPYFVFELSAGCACLSSDARDMGLTVGSSVDVLHDLPSADVGETTRELEETAREL